MKAQVILVLFFIVFNTTTFAQDTVAIDTTIEFQTIEGWGHGGGVLGHVGGAYNMIDTTVANPLNIQILDYLTDDLGLTGSRTWEVGPRIDGTGMDNGDCDSIDWTKFQTGSLPPQLADYLVYFKNKIIAQGIQPSFYSSPGYPTHATDQKPWIMFHPGERAQQIWSSALYMKNTFGIDINYDVIYNEPSGAVTSTVLAEDIKALGTRIIAHGLSTRSQYAEAVAPLTDWNFITPVQNDSEMWSYTGRISYHNYGTADPYRSMISGFALNKGITTAQTEMANPTFDDLYNDLTLGGVSYWEVAYAAPNTLVPVSGLTSFTPSSTYFRLRQLMHYVRPGAVRISTSSSDTLLHVLAFKKNGAITTIVENTGGSQINVLLTNIPPGTYGVSKSPSGATAFAEMGVVTVTATDTITIPVIPNGGVTTLYPYPGPNHAPVIMTYVTNPGYLVDPDSSVTLSTSANDAELNALSYQWTVISFPGGATPTISSPNAASTSVNGLTAAGNYIFQIDVSDGTTISSKKVYLIKYASTPPTVLGSAGFRIAAPYGLVFDLPGVTTHANIELPTSSVVLQIGVANITGVNFTGQGTWSLVSQPGGANAVVDSTIYIYVSLRANATNMTVPGDYIFQVNVQNPGHPDFIQQIICTVHPASSPPVINSITPSPAVLTLPDDATTLTAITSDPDFDLLRHWWAVVSAPAGANPQFDYQCKPVTNVSGLTVPGLYVFQLRAFDDLHMVTQNVNVQVNIANGIEEVYNTNEIIFYPNPVRDELRISVNASADRISSVEISNAMGEILKELKTDEAAGSGITINMIALSPGIYFVKVRTRDKIVTGRVIKL